MRTISARLFAAAALAALLVAPLAVAAGPLADCPPADSSSDCDGVPDAVDNCVEVANIDQCDTDRDGYGNRCDGDFDNNRFTTSGDFVAAWLPDFTMGGVDTGKGTDLDCNGAVTSGDFVGLWLPLFTHNILGPSGLACAGTVPCAP